jgi:hypothetical protein
MEAPPEEFAYTALLSGDSSKPDALAVIDVKRGSPTYSQVVHTVTMPYKGDEFHHFGWNACSSALSPLTGHAFLERRYLAGIAKARALLDELIAGQVLDIADLAQREKRSVRSTSMQVSLAFLAPSLVQAIADNRLPRGIGLTRLADLPSEWSKQFKMLGLQAPR